MSLRIDNGNNVSENWSWCMVGQVFIIGDGEYMLGSNCWFNGRLVIERLMRDLCNVSWNDIQELSRNASEEMRRRRMEFSRSYLNDYSGNYI
jgi:hypothetical protein